ncbi:MAG: hypothetical protein JST00_06580 [Deltaproteobacteria bacterium]|nr:hypothetical protein [Deltaproteobacteria bacterium]
MYRPSSSNIQVVAAIAVAAVSAVGTGCTSPFTMYADAKRLAPSDLACPEAQVSRQYTGSGDYGFRGCGRWIVYRCMSSGDDRSECAPTAMGNLDPVTGRPIYVPSSGP